jgi:hypothetical protein
LTYVLFVLHLACVFSVLFYLAKTTHRPSEEEQTPHSC